MVKFVEKLRSNITYGRVVKWKDQRDIWVIVSYWCIINVFFFAALAKNRIEMFVIFSIRIITLNKPSFFLMISWWDNEKLKSKGNDQSRLI
jgi:hypothetical protein